MFLCSISISFHSVFERRQGRRSICIRCFLLAIIYWYLSIHRSRAGVQFWFVIWIGTFLFDQYQTCQMRKILQRIKSQCSPSILKSQSKRKKQRKKQMVIKSHLYYNFRPCDRSNFVSLLLCRWAFAHVLNICDFGHKEVLKSKSLILIWSKNDSR